MFFDQLLERDEQKHGIGDIFVNRGESHARGARCPHRSVDCDCLRFGGPCPKHVGALLPSVERNSPLVKCRASAAAC